MFARFVSFFFFKQKTAYEMRISDWSSDVCSSDLRMRGRGDLRRFGEQFGKPPRRARRAQQLTINLGQCLERARDDPRGEHECREAAARQLPAGDIVGGIPHEDRKSVV